MALTTRIKLSPIEAVFVFVQETGKCKNHMYTFWTAHMIPESGMLIYFNDNSSCTRDTFVLWSNLGFFS